jgi:N12 class adenine-specific DNA methylase/predicted RNA methylase
VYRDQVPTPAVAAHARADTGPAAGPATSDEAVSDPAAGDGAELSAAELYAWQEDLESGRDVSIAERRSFTQAQYIAEVAAERRFDAELTAGVGGAQPVELPDPQPDLFTEPDDVEPSDPFPVGTGLEPTELDAWRADLDTGRPATPTERRAFALAEQHLAATPPPTQTGHTTTAPRFRPAGQADLAPSGEMTRIRANLAALRTLRAVQAAARPATPDEQAVLARWSGWGAVPAALDDTKTQFAWVRQELAELLDEREMAAARRTVINAHYTDAALVEAIWQAVGQLGFRTGRVLEPGCGSGNFIAYAPDGAEVTGVELDPSTAAIAAALHPQATILAESFADTRIATGGVDLVVGNVPFGDVRLHDKRDNRSNHAIHNHFILKSLRATRPGGLVAVITSAYTMDAANPAARREMQQMADLVGAVRLPSKAHARAAGTDALTDVLIFRRREDDREPAPFDWETTAGLDVDGVSLRVNDYFLTHPQRVLGRFAAGDGLYRHDEVSVVGDPAAAPAQLGAALAEIAAQAAQTDLTMSSDAVAASTSAPAARLPQTTTHPDGYLRANPDGTFARLDDGQWEPYAPPKTQAGELRALLGLRDTAVALLEAEAASLDDSSDIDRLRATLNTRYDAYHAAFGPINRFTEVPARRKDKTTGKMVPAVDEETGEPIMRRERPRAGGFRHDPFAPVVRALEIFNEEDQSATKADIFRQRVVAPRPPRLGADTPAEAVAICLDDYGEVRLDTIAWLLGIPDSEARAALGTLVFDDPATGRLEPAAAYLSGDVKTKLTQARTAADDDERYAVNVAALTEVVPRDLGPDEITIKMGAPWIDPAYIQQFLTEILDDPSVTVEYGGGAMWTVDSARTDTVAARSTWGTERRSATEIAQHILEQREFVIKDTVGRGRTKRTVVNVDAIMAATEKAVEMRERFADWVWEDAERAAALVATYNETFQRYVPRSYDDVQLSLPGLAVTFRPDPHQVAAVARIIHEPAVGLYHAVGAGKTASMIMGAMELRRLGLARKPVIVVPNQLLDQWSREFLRLYPQAKVLSAGTEDMKRDKGQDRRRLMVARMATGNWDAVILTEDAFEMLPMSTEAEQAYVDAQMADFDERISEARARGEEKTLKRLETLKANREARLEERLDTDQDAGIWWELTGIDYIFRDESHRDKNLRTVSNVSGMSIKGSQRAQQMDMKLAWLRERQPRWGTRASGTPIANSIVELFTEYRFLRPDLMAGQGVTDVDSFLATYAEGEVVIEVTPDGGGLRNKTRFKFVNLDELITPTRVFSDVKNKDELGLERPPLAERADGERAPELVLVDPSDELLAKVADLVDRAARLKGRRPEKGEDNILKIVGEGAAAALDLALVGLSTDAPQKLDVAAERIAGMYHDHLDRVYTGPDGQPQPTTGALQMVFCDLGTPSDKPDRFSSYAKLRSLLAARGVPADKVRFIHEAKDDKQRAELFAACRDGRVAVLVGSTEKMGTGVNVQERLLALHHLDCPWRPCDLEQREGRIDRRGNQNPEIHILRYVTERSLDAFRWQKVAYKARLADQILRGQAGREADDIGEATLSYEEMKAAATGNPLLVEHAKAKADLTRLERLERGWHRNQSQLHWTVRSSRQEITISQALIGEASAAIARRTDTRGDAFTMTVRGHDYTKRAEANDRLKGALGLVLADPANRDRPAVEVGTFGGFTIAAKAETMTVGKAPHYKTVTGLRVELVDAPGTELRLTADDLKTADLVTRLDNRLAKLEALRDHAEAEITRRETEIARAEQELAKPFRHAEALVEAKAHFQHLDVQVVALAAAADAETGSGEPEEADGQPVDDEQTRTGPHHGPGPGQEPTPVYGDHHAPSRPRPVASTPATDTTVTQVLARAELPADQQQWLTARLRQLADDPHLRQVARANDYDRARQVIDERIPQLFADAVDAADVDGEALAVRFFDNTDGWFQEAFTAAASRAVYQQGRDPGDPPAQADPPAATADPAPPIDQPADADPPPQRLPETLRTRRGHDFYPPPELAATIPRLYATERVPAGDKMLHLHYFGGANDIWLAEYDPETGEGFGYICLGYPDDAEWGSISLPELEPINRGLLIIERDLYWTPVPASQANLPGPRAPRPSTTPAPTAQPAADPPPELTAAQRAVVDELGKEPGEPWSIHREWRMRTFARLSREDLATLPDDTRQALTDAVTDLLDSPAWKDRATARRLLHRWSDAPAAADLTDAQQRVLDVLCHPDSSYGVPDAGRVGRYGRLTAAEYLALDPGDREDIKADLKEIAASGATKTIPRNRTTLGTTIRGVPADHVTAASNLLRRLGPDLAPGEWRSNADQVGRTVVGLRLNPGDQIQTRRGTATVDRVGLDLDVHLVGGGTLADSTRRYRLLAAGADPTAETASPPGVEPEQAATAAVDSAAVPAQPEPGPAQPAPDDPAPEGAPPHAATPETPAWLDGVVLDQETTAGAHQVLRRAQRRASSVWVEARHPQLGMLPRGHLSLAAPAGTTGQPTWRLIDPDGTPLGEHTGAYPEAEARLLAATSALDEPLSPQQLADSAAEDDPTQPETPQPDPQRPEPDQPGQVGAGTSPVAGSGTAAPPESNEHWASRIEIVEGSSLLVRGTTGAPREERLRALLKQYNFRYQRATGAWRFAGRPADRAAAVADIRRWLEAQTRTAEAQAARPATTLPPTEQQQRILDAAAAGKAVAVQALAGTGKTSTLLMLAAARPGARIVYVAFNRSIADEAARKFGRNVRADTSHAFAREGLSGSPLHPKLARVGQGLRWPEDWAAHLGIGTVDDGSGPVEAETIARMVQATVRTFRESAAETITAAHLPRPLVEGAPQLTEPVLEYARAAWADISDPNGQLLMDHDDYLKLWALGHPRLPADLVLFDEAQDINPVLRKVIQDQPMQTIVVGDSNQSIYGFRGAVDALKHWPADVTLPLTQSWRFGSGVAAVGNQFLTLLRSPYLLTGNPAITSTVGAIEQPDAVLARTNAGAVAAVFDAVDDGRRVALVGGGRAIQDIAQAAKDLQAGRRTKHPELSRFADWDEVRAFCEDGEDAQSLRAFVRLVDRRGADALLRMVKDLVDEEDTRPDGSPAYDVIVSTAHKSKGREWDHVRIAEDFPQPKEDLATRQVTLPSDEELRLAYVAVTRAKRGLELGSLAWIDDVDAAALAGTRGRGARPEPVHTAEAADSPDRVDQPAGPEQTPSTGERPAEPEHAEVPAAADHSGTAGAASGDDHDPDIPGPFSALERAQIRNAVADHAAGYYGGPLGLGRDSAARYTSEGHLKDLVARHGLGPVWEAVAAVIAADPGVLERSQRQRTDDTVARQARAEDLAAQALVAFKDRDLDQAQRLAEAGQLVDPLYRPGRSERRLDGWSWSQIHEAIAHRRDHPVDAEPAAPDAAAQTVAAVPTAAQLARLDTAPGVVSGPATAGVAHGGHPRPSAPTGRRPGPSV